MSKSGDTSKAAFRNASQRLVRAKRALNDLMQAQDFAETEVAWSDFVVASGAFFSKLEQAVKGNGRAEAWFGRVKMERRKDALLSYIHHARNSDQHGIDDLTKRLRQRVTIGTDPNDTSPFPRKSEIVLSLGPDNTVVGISRSSGAAMQVTIDNVPKVVLISVVDRGKSYDPPSIHLNEAILEGSPREVARLAFDYMEKALTVSGTL